MQMACAARAGELDLNEAASRVIRELTRDHRVVQIHLEPLAPDERGSWRSASRKRRTR